MLILFMWLLILSRKLSLGGKLLPSPSGEIIATSLMIHYIPVGFIQGFLLAYLWLSGAFARAVASQKKPGETVEKL